MVAIVLPEPPPLWRPTSPPTAPPAIGPSRPASPCCFTARTEVTVPQLLHTAATLGAGAGASAPATVPPARDAVLPVAGRAAARSRGAGAAAVRLGLGFGLRLSCSLRLER